MRIFSKIDIGRVRSSNQDALFTAELDDNTALAVVCDGMGGARAGNIASECAVKAISAYVINSYRAGMDAQAVSRLLKNAVISANIEIYDMADKNESLRGMGTTAVVAAVNEGFAVIAHVGDSRAYIVNDNANQITRDHSVVQTLVESGKLTPEEARTHPRKNVITRALGVEEDVEADCVITKIDKGDTLLLCTDGLTNYVDNEELLKIFRETDIQAVAERLVEQANHNGGGDNITVITITHE